MTHYNHIMGNKNPIRQVNFKNAELQERRMARSQKIVPRACRTNFRPEFLTYLAQHPSVPAVIQDFKSSFILSPR